MTFHHDDMRRLTYCVAIAALMLVGAGCKPTPPLPSEAPERAEAESAETQAPRVFCEDGTEVTGKPIVKTHIIGESPCPQPIGPLYFDFGGDHAGHVLTTESLNRLQDFLEVSDGETRTKAVGSGILLGLELNFNCNIDDYSSHEERKTIPIRITPGAGLTSEGYLIQGDQRWRFGDTAELDIRMDVVTRQDYQLRESGQDVDVRLTARRDTCISPERGE